MKTEIVVNKCFGGFGLSEKALSMLGLTYSQACNMSRHNPKLVDVVKELGEEAETEFSSLEIIEISANKYRIVEYDGFERVEVPEEIEWINL